MVYRICIVTEENSWFNEHLAPLIDAVKRMGNDISVVYDVQQIPPGDVAFLLSLGQIVPQNIRDRNIHNIVVHASALPKGKGWSPLTWQVLEGKSSIPFSVFEAVDQVDAGEIYLTSNLDLTGTETLEELRKKQASETVRLCVQFVEKYPEIAAVGRKQNPDDESFYLKRGPEDSQLDIEKSIQDQFDLLRVCDPDRYPAFFDYRGYRWVLTMERQDLPPEGKPVSE